MFLTNLKNFYYKLFQYQNIFQILYSMESGREARKHEFLFIYGSRT